jgi:basic membrane protein A and related proteins
MAKSVVAAIWFQLATVVASVAAGGAAEAPRTPIWTGNFDVVLWAGFGPTAWKLFPLVQRLPATRFVYVDADMRATPIEHAPNATGLRFADDAAGFLAGYLGGLVSARRSPHAHTRPIVSVIGGLPIAPVTTLVEGFRRGAREALPGVAVHVAYSGTFTDQSVCERIANRQIDRGSNVVFAAAGTCSLGALSAAGLRGAWGVGADADRSYLGSHILVSTVKR